MDCNPPDSSAHGILQARILEWLAISFFKRSSDPRIKLEPPALLADSFLLSHGEADLHILHVLFCA